MASKIKFEREKQRYTVQDFNERYAIMTMINNPTSLDEQDGE